MQRQLEWRQRILCRRRSARWRRPPWATAMLGPRGSGCRCGSCGTCSASAAAALPDSRKSEHGGHKNTCSVMLPQLAATGATLQRLSLRELRTCSVRWRRQWSAAVAAQHQNGGALVSEPTGPSQTHVLHRFVRLPRSFGPRGPAAGMACKHHAPACVRPAGTVHGCCNWRRSDDLTFVALHRRRPEMWLVGRRCSRYHMRQRLHISAGGQLRLSSFSVLPAKQPQDRQHLFCPRQRCSESL